MSVNEDWRYQELAKWIQANEDGAFFEEKTTFLVNPDTIGRVDDIIKKHFWPAVERGVKGLGRPFDLYNPDRHIKLNDASIGFHGRTSGISP